MLEDLSDLRESLFAVRVLREQILATPLRPDSREALTDWARGENRRPVHPPVPADGRIDASWLRDVAEACGGGARRSGPGSAFHGRAAPQAAQVPALSAEMLETLHSPVALETWPPAVRAFAAHFLLRIIQPFEAPAEAVGAAVEAALLEADGFPGDRLLLPEPHVGADVARGRPDPDAFVRARLHRWVERLADTQERVRAELARAALLGWVEGRGTGLTGRQRRIVRWLAEGAPGRSLDFREYVRLHAGRGAPSLRSLQRDWKGLRESGLLGERAAGGGLFVDPDAIAYGKLSR